MKAILYGALLLLPVIGGSSNLPSRSPLCPAHDSVPRRSSDDYRAIFQRRTKERAYQLTDYLSFMSRQKKKKSARMKYAQAARQLFDTKASACCRELHDTTGHIRRVPVEQLFTQIARGKIRLAGIDSLFIPLWDSTLAVCALSGETDRIKARRVKVAFDTLVSRRPCEFAVDDSLHLVRESTVEGFEWIPLFGDMDITIQTTSKGKHRYEKNPTLPVAPLVLPDHASACHGAKHQPTRQ